jgi:hypothetical protein
VAAKAKPVLATAKKPVSTGFGPSKLHVAPEGSFTPEPEQIDILECHVAGIAVKDMPRENQMRLLYQQTDEGIIWWNENRSKLENRDSKSGPGPSGRGMKLADGRTATDEEEKKVVKYRDELSTDFDEFRAAEDPFAEPMRAHTPPGHRGLFMSLKQCEKQGMNRGGLRYEPVLVKNSKGDFERVIVLGMFLASVPEEAAAKSERYYAARNKEKQVSVTEVVRKSVEQVMSTSDFRDVASKRHALDDLIGSEVESQQVGDSELLHQFANEQ